MNLLIRIAGCAALAALFLPGVHFPDLVRYLLVSLLFVCSVPLVIRLRTLIGESGGSFRLGLCFLTLGVWSGLLVLFHRACLLYPIWALVLFGLCLSIIWIGGSARRIRVQIAVAAGTGFFLLELVQHGPAFIVCWTVLAVLTSWHETRCSQITDYVNARFGKWWLAFALGLVFVLYICHIISRDVFRISYSFEAGLPRNIAALVCCSLPLLVSIAALRIRSRNVWRVQTLLGLLLILFVSAEGIIRSFGPLGYGKIIHAVTRDEYDLLYSDDNLMGMRGEEFTLQKPADSIRILILGDSITYGAGVKSGEAFPQLLKDELPDLTRKTVEVLNISRSGWNSENELKALRKYLPYQPDMIVLGVCMNDVETSTGNFQPEPTFLSGISDRYFSWSYTFSLLSYLSERRREAKTESGYDHYLSSHFRSDSEGWRRFEKDITAMCELAGGTQIPFVAVLFPILSEPTSGLEAIHDQMSKSLVQNNLELVDMRVVYKHHHWRDLYVSFADGHPNALAHRLAAEAVQMKIVELLAESK